MGHVLTDYLTCDIMQSMNDGSNVFAERLREAFRRSELSLNRLNKLANTQYSSTYRFFTGQADDATLTTVEKWCSVLRLELRPVKAKRR